jgi:hypothetical protein
MCAAKARGYGNAASFSHLLAIFFVVTTLVVQDVLKATKVATMKPMS